MELKIPFIDQPIGSGDIVGDALASVGITPEKVTELLRKAGAIGPTEDCGCKGTKQSMNDKLKLMPLRVNSWATMEYPNIPPGWELTRSAISTSRPGVTVNFYENRALIDNGTVKSSANMMYIWQVVDGKYTGGSAFCCLSTRPSAEKRWNELCH